MQLIKSMFIITCVIFMTVRSSWAAAETSSDTYKQANAAYEKGDYIQSAQLYQKSIQEGLISEELFYNLGNAYYKQQNHGEAALWYRRALILNPRMPEPRQNLRTLKNRVGLLDFEPKGIDRLISHFRESELVTLLTSTCWLTLLCLASGLFVRQLKPWRSLLILASCLLACLGVISFVGLKIYSNRIAVDHRAVVTAVDAVAQTSPVPDSNTVTELPPGSEVRIVTNSGPWQYIDIPGQLRGWVKTEAISPLWPPPPGT